MIKMVNYITKSELESANKRLKVAHKIICKHNLESEYLEELENIDL